MIHIDNTYYDPWVLGGVCVRAQSYLTLCNPMDCSTLGSSVHGIFQARILEWVAISYSRGSFRPDPGIEPLSFTSPISPAFADGFFFFFFYHCTTWEAPRSFGGRIIINS